MNGSASSTPRFSSLAFLKDRAPFIAITAVLIAVVAAILTVLQVSVSGILLVVILIAFSTAACLAYDYMRQQRFWNELEDATSSLDAVEYFADLIEEPEFLSGKAADDACRTIAACAADEITGLKSNIRANREYVELWVHETKTPIAAAKLILDKMHGTDVANLKRELERTENLVEQALFSARSNALTNDYLIRETSLSEMVWAACKQNMHYLTSLGLSIEIDIDPDIDVFADKTWLSFIISQVITNSAKYDSSAIAFTAVVSEEESASACTVLKIQDNGCGIPDRDVPRVFDRGFTGDVGRAHGSATGMGLYLAARMCAQMGLGIMLASEEGRGTRVEVSFPHDRRRALLAQG